MKVFEGYKLIGGQVGDHCLQSKVIKELELFSEGMKSNRTLTELDLKGE